MIAIASYGLGNVTAFANVYKKLNVEYRVVTAPEDLVGVTKIILPGVGSFDQAMMLLNQSGLRESLERCVMDLKTPVLGICVGMQMLARSSEEGVLPGLGWIDATVERLQLPAREDNKCFPLPHMGWNNLVPVQGSPLFNQLENPRFYFLHSYHMSCQDPNDVLAVAEYGRRLTCVVRSENVYGIQCHPEKSHRFGIQLLANFASL